MRYCFDLDDTICVHNNRDYPNAVPVLDVIRKMVSIRDIDQNSKIIIHTSRGMASCGGDVRLAEERNRPTIEEWLKRYGVPYDEIIFGKPLADVYVDDKAVSAHRFANGSIREFKGFSGASVLQVANMIIKEGDKTKHEYEWFKSDKSAGFTRHQIPVIYSYTLGKLYMEYISGATLSDLVASDPAVIGEAYLVKVSEILKEFAAHREEGENDTEAYCQFIRERGKATGIDTAPLCRGIMGSDCLREKTFCHGDFTMLNIIVSGGRLYLIDPSASPLSSWLLDAAKLRASLNGLDAAITGRENTSASLVPMFDELFSGHIETIKLLEKTHYVRVMFYAKKLGKVEEFNKLNQLLRL